MGLPPLVLLPLLALVPLPGPASALRDFRGVSRNVSGMLDALLDSSRYDKRIRPHFGGPPVQITTNMVVNSMGSVSDTDESYTMDVYFRQVWRDPRLQFSLEGRDQLSLSWLFMGLIWRPDTFFMNGKKSHMHRITVPNTFFRLSNDGVIICSMRMTVRASCPMHLRKFPLDSQKCPLLISSYGYKSSDVVYNWTSTDSDVNVSIEPNMEIAQYDLANVQTDDHSVVYRGESGKDEYSMLKVVFHFKRHTGFFMLQVYVPCGLIVCCSWVSFWIDPDAVPARVSLGVTTALSLTTMGFGGKAQMPKVSYPTALDWFVILCFSFVFAVMIEYAIINVLDKITKDLKRLLQQSKAKNSVAEGERSGPGGDPPGASLEAPAHRQRSASMVELPPLLTEARRRASQILAPVVGALRRLSSAVVLRPDDQEREEATSPERPGTWNIPTIRLWRRHSAGSEVTAEPEYAELEELTRATVASPEEDYDYRLAVDGAEDQDQDQEQDKDQGQACGWLLRSHALAWWRDLKLLPREEDVRAQISSGEPPDKFSRIDIRCRRLFPVSFVALLVVYWVAYAFYITDEFPVKELRTLRYGTS